MVTLPGAVLGATHRGSRLRLASYGLLMLLPCAAAAQEPAASPTPEPAATPVESTPLAPAASPAPAGSAAAGAVPAPVAETPVAATPGSAQAVPRESVPPPDTAGERPPEPGQIRVRADLQEQLEKGHFRASGFVDLVAGDLRIQADHLDLYQVEGADGRVRSRLEAEGNVVFSRGEERLAGERLEMNLDDNTGTFHDAVGYAQPGVFFEGSRVERLAASTYRIVGGSFTSCAQPTPRWAFSASSATIDVGDKIVARNVLFKVKSVPTLYIPIFAYPLKEDQRATGFLFPHFGNSSTKGFNVGGGFFWAMGRSFDQTFYVDSYSKYGWGFGHEFRYARDAPSLGTFRSYLFSVDDVDALDYDLDWTAVQQLPGGFRASVAVRQFSNTEFQRQIQDNLNLASSRRQRASLNVQGNVGPARVQLLAEGTETAFGDDERRINRRLPMLRLTGSPRKLGKSAIVLAWEARGEGLQNGTQDGVASYGRLDVWPELSRSFSTSFLQLTPRLRARYTRYTGSLEDPNDPFNVAGPALDRRYLETGVELRGPVFSRVFLTEGNFYSDRFKHEISPELTWSYRTAVDAFDLIPKFDGEDYALGNNELRYALVNRLLAKRSEGGGRSVPYEFFNWRLQQTYYVQIADSQNEFDPNYSSSFYGPGGVPSHYSPVLSRMRFRPTPGFTLGFNAEYDINFDLFRNLSSGLQWDARRFGLDASWNRAKKTAVKEENRVLTRDFLRAQARLELVPGRLRLDGGGDYDLLLSQMLSARARLRYDVQCCGFEVEMIQYKYNDRDERQFRFSIELANIGSFGSFMGENFEQQGGRY